MHSAEIENRNLPPATGLPVVTPLLVLALLALFVGVEVQQARRLPGQAREPIARQWGAVQELEFVTDGERVEQETLQGPFDLWEGEWWRVPVNALHHGGTGNPLRLVHLLFDCAGLIYLGWRLEPWLGRWRFFRIVLWLSILTISTELLLGNVVVGATGILCGLLGIVLVARHPRPGQLPPPLWGSEIWDRGALALIAAGLIARLIGYEWIASGSHLVGLAYGWCVGQVYYGRVQNWGLIRHAFRVSHLGLVVLLALVTHPVWNGYFHWYRAERAETPDDTIRNLKRAVKADASLGPVWCLLAAWLHDEGDIEESWETILRGLQYNRSDAQVNTMALEIWKRFNSPMEQRWALDKLRAVFGEESDAWIDRLDLHVVEHFFPRSDLGMPVPWPPAAEEYALDRLIVLPPDFTQRDEEEPHAPQIDPDQPGSAALGVPL